MALSREEANELDGALNLICHIEQTDKIIELAIFIGDFFVSGKLDDDPALREEIQATFRSLYDENQTSFVREKISVILGCLQILDKGSVFTKQERQSVISNIIEYSKQGFFPDPGPFILKAVTKIVEKNLYDPTKAELRYLKDISIAFDNQESLMFFETYQEMGSGIKSDDLMQIPQMRLILLNMESSDKNVRIDALGQCIYLLSVCYENDNKKEGKAILDYLEKYSQKENDQSVLHILQGSIFAQDLSYPSKRYTPLEKSDRLDFIFSVFSLVPNHGFLQHILLKGIKAGVNGLRYQLKDDRDMPILQHAREYNKSEAMLPFSTEFKYLVSCLEDKNVSDVPKNDQNLREKSYWKLIQQVQSHKENRQKRSEALKRLHDFVVELAWNKDKNEVLEKAAIGSICNYTSPLIEEESFVRKQVLTDLADAFLRDFYTDKPHMQTFVIDVFLQRAKPSERFDRIRYIALNTLTKAHVKSPIQWTKDQKDVLKELLKDERAADFAKELLRQPKKKSAALKNKLC